MVDQSEMQEKLRVIRESYANQLPDKLNKIAMTWGQLSPSVWNEDEFQVLYRLVHNLAGSGKTFGFSALSDAAAKLENYLKQIGEARQVFSKQQRDQVKLLLSKLNQSASQRDTGKSASSALIATPVYSSSDLRANRIFIVEDDVTVADEMKVQLSYFGYDVTVFHTLSEFNAAMQKDSHVVVVMDVNFPEDSRGGVHAMIALQRGREVPIPVVFLTTHNELDIRLEAVRAGGLAYLVKPINYGMLIDKLDELTTTHAQAAYRVMIVDDAVTLTDYLAAGLEQVGMEVKVVNDPLQVLQPLLEFSPDLIIIDMYMPGCNGMELAKVIRQMNEFVSIPIVFLSGETDPDKQLLAIGMGGDDFLTKPIQLPHLISSVTSRIKRSLVLRSFMMRDSLTGLLNHSSIKTLLSHEMVRARRQEKPLSFAMVDIDKFKDVNDTYGHPIGDRVIKSLSRLLKQRLRENDLVGRYGGEEFAVVLSDVDGPTAVKIMDSIREDFAQLRHMGADKEFSVTFSCGVTDNSNYIFSSSSKLVDAADKALYKAKHAGRNQVMLADEKPV